MSNEKSFIEVQFPVSKVSKESYKERKAGSGQTLTGLGKWWGRKPLILVRAALLGLLMPTSDNPKKDREIFLKILSMDEVGLIKRKNKSIPVKIVYEHLTPSERKRYFKDTEQIGKIEYRAGTTRDEKADLQDVVFKRMSYDEKLQYCMRPEEVNNIDDSEWKNINEYLGTNANSIQKLFEDLGKRRFGHTPVVGDCFSGGGSIPFEAARVGCEVYASDLNPIAGLLTWSAINLCGSSKNDINKLKNFQDKIFELADKQIIDWKIETNENGDRANSYYYCNEAVCPECGYRVPLAPSWIVRTGTKTIGILKANEESKSFDIEIRSKVSDSEFENAKASGTIKNYNLVCPHCKAETPIPSIRKDKDDGVKREYRYNIPNALRKWDSTDFINRNDDIYTERLYCIQYERSYYDEDGKLKKETYYINPTEEDLMREEKVINILKGRFSEWQRKGYIPNSRIEQGWNTNQLTYERGWAYWQNLFNPRQLLINGMLMELIDTNAGTQKEKVVGLLSINKLANWNSKLCIIVSARESGGITQTFANQALNTIFNYGTRSLMSLKELYYIDIIPYNSSSKASVVTGDARQIKQICDFWVTDPPYADAVNYHELSEFFLAWGKKLIENIFPNWYTDSKRALAVKGIGDSFNNSMVEVYRNIAKNMSDDGMQIVMFTHQDVSVWADLTMILWASGLRVTAAWNIATETESGGLKDGNYVKGTVLLILRKQNSNDTAYLDELYPEIEEEVKLQINSMKSLEDKEDPNFTDADYLLSAYAASLKVLTSYRQIEDIDIEYELGKTRLAGEESAVERIINEAVKIAYDYLIPVGFDSYTWKILTSEERFYIKGLDFEKNNVYQVGAYQELARGFGVKEYLPLLASTRANQARLKTAIEFGMRGVGDNEGFSSSILRNVLAALHQSIKEEDTTNGRNWLKNELTNYWQQRNTIIEILDYIATLGNIENMGHWEQEANYAKLLRELIKNDGV